ncbi:MAG: Phosphatidylglycerophosphatase PgpA fused to adenosylcobinamide amidohydrolase CbiZ [Candidatus Methanohalarchaeum thermophilum]|uniref:Phosphatidylglycerophosphatase PgpA fused to adenosylcobinamide amidohydrolase CbiZ n=1 Tax=Methanohalarchaeum thermophilum TaxID=1903181 RepID=A0A1Q6DVJ4_METT1|nr:MAG: Phosphatidylglycerophosphatase PgpA fused to adenosylcobinamide amidohydrolase CbiZ [Candidatus Methanohalarchaeum thermophilum]
MSFRVCEDKVIIEGEYRVMSSAPLNGGLKVCNQIVNHEARSGYEDVEELFENSLEIGDLSEVVGFITNVDMGNRFVREVELEEGYIKVFLTAGIGKSLETNTINIILTTNLSLSDTGLLNLFIIITEAKVSALRELDVIYNGDNVWGTPTDAIAVAKEGKEEGNIDFTGRATEIGQETFNSIKKGVKESIIEEDGYLPDRSMEERLKERNIELDELIEAGFELFETEDEIELEYARKDVKKKLRKYLNDHNIHFLISAGFYLENELNQRMKIKEDPAYLITDELLGINIAEYIGGKMALFNFMRYDQSKPGILSELGPFMDDIIAGLIAGCMTEHFG